MLALGSGCKYRLSLAERFDCTESIINQLLGDSYQNPISEWQVTSKLHLLAGFKSESDTYFSPHMARPLFIDHFHLLLFPTLCTCLSHSLGKAHVLTLAKITEKQTLLESFFEKGERPKDETAEASKTANKKKAAFKRKHQESHLNYGSIATGDSHSPILL